MTCDEIMALEGRELDKAVARHVMGRNVVNIDPVDGEIGYFVEREGEWVKARGKAFPKLDELPNYSTDMAAAWEVAEKTRLFLIPGQTGDNEWKWVCAQVSKAPGWGFTGLPHERHWVDVRYETEHVVSESAPLAICRAALLAVMGEGE